MPEWKPIETAPRDRPIAIVAVTPEMRIVAPGIAAPAEFDEVIGGGAHVSIDVCQWRDDGFVLGWGMDTGVGHANMRAWCEVHELNLRGLLPAHALGKAV